MKKIIDLDKRLSKMSENDKDELPTLREVMRMVGNVKADTADNARRVRRIINKLRDAATPDLVIENDDLAFLQKEFERNMMNLTAWCQGQVLDLIDAAEKVEPERV